MRSAKVGAYCPSPAPTLVVLVVLLVGSVQFVQCHNVDDYNEFDNPELLPLFTQLGYGQISNMTTMLSAEFQKRSNFRVKDPDADWNQAFNLSFNLDLLATCIQKTKGMSSFYKLHLSLFGYLENPSKIGKNGFYGGKKHLESINSN